MGTLSVSTCGAGVCGTGVCRGSVCGVVTWGDRVLDLVDSRRHDLSDVI